MFQPGGPWCCPVIEEELRNMNLENFLDFNRNGRYELARGEGCDGPLLGHLEVQCGSTEGVRYGSEAVRLNRVSGFREAVIARDNKMEEMREARENKKEEIRAGKFVEAMKLALVSKEQKDRPGATTQLVKPRFPPLWYGQ